MEGHIRRMPPPYVIDRSLLHSQFKRDMLRKRNNNMEWGDYTAFHCFWSELKTQFTESINDIELYYSLLVQVP